jgi:Flp pilus assembly protein TadD
MRQVAPASVAAPTAAGGDAGGRGEVAGAAPRRARPRAAPALGLAALALLAAVALALPYVAEEEVAAASSGWPSDPAQAFARLRRAAQLNPLSARPRLVAGVIALELGRPRAAEAAFAQALARDGDDWFAWFGRGLAASAAGERTKARDSYTRARALDPAEPLLREALARLNGRDPLTAQEAFGTLRRDVQRLSGSVRASVATDSSV